ncbi:hypothetical protein Tco_0033711 [Tanacetum coccineum]
MPLGDHAAHWANYLGELVRKLSLHYPSWHGGGHGQRLGVKLFSLSFYVKDLKFPKPSLTCVPTWILIAGQKSMRASNSICKRSTMARRLLSRKGIGFLTPRTGHTTWIMESSATREYPSLIHTFFLTHIVGGVFLNPQDKALYDEMLRLQGLGSNTPSCVPYIEDEIMAIVHGGK